MTDRGGVRRGQVVYGSDGVRLGRVFHCDVAGFVVEKGIVFAEDYPVFYDEVLSVEGDEVRLRVPSDALVREAEAETWDPPRDPDGSDGGIDLEPLRAGMAEVDEEQERLRALEAGLVEQISLGGGWASRARLVRASAGEPARVGPAPGALSAEEQRDLASLASAVGELERRISEEVEDYEREGANAPPGTLTERELRAAAAIAGRLQRRLAAAARRREAAARMRAGRRRRRPEEVAREGQPEVRRIDYVRSAPGAVAALRRLETYLRRSGSLEPPLLELVRLRVSQLNGCSPCTEVHGEKARHSGIDEQRLEAVATWRDSPVFTERERAALAWTDAVTRVGAARVDDETYERARQHFGERGLVDLTMAVVAINGWNRLAVAFESGLGAYRHALT